MERAANGEIVTFHEGWEGMKGTLGGPDCGCVKCLTARWKAEWEAYLISHESHLLRGGTAVPSEFELRRLFTEASFNCFRPDQRAQVKVYMRDKSFSVRYDEE